MPKKDDESTADSESASAAEVEEKALSVAKWAGDHPSTPAADAMLQEEVGAVVVHHEALGLASPEDPPPVVPPAHDPNEPAALTLGGGLLPSGTPPGDDSLEGIPFDRLVSQATVCEPLDLDRFRFETAFALCFVSKVDRDVAKQIKNAARGSPRFIVLGRNETAQLCLAYLKAKLGQSLPATPGTARRATLHRRRSGAPSRLRNVDVLASRNDDGLDVYGQRRKHAAS